MDPTHVWNQKSTPVDLAGFEGKPCYAELDMTSTTDITAFVLVFPPHGNDEHYRIAP